MSPKLILSAEQVPSFKTRAVCVVLHDVAPATWPACERLIAAIEQVGKLPITMLVVPSYHKGAPSIGNRPFEDMLSRRLACGDELALHGYRHLDTGTPASLYDVLRRRWYTASEGEFAGLELIEAIRRLEAGTSWFTANGWPVGGFVAPAWLMSRDAWRALQFFSFSYTTSLRRLYLLRDGVSVSAQSLVYSVRSAWRRRISQSWNTRLASRLADRPMIRLGLHPADAKYPHIMAHWQGLLATLLESREAMTKAQYVQSLRALDSARALSRAQGAATRGAV